LPKSPSQENLRKTRYIQNHGVVPARASLITKLPCFYITQDPFHLQSNRANTTGLIPENALLLQAATSPEQRSQELGAAELLASAPAGRPSAPAL